MCQWNIMYGAINRRIRRNIMKLHFEIRPNEKYQDDLFNLFEYFKEIDSSSKLPDNIEVKVWVELDHRGKNVPLILIPYKTVYATIQYQPMQVEVCMSTDNRRLEFNRLSFFHWPKPMVPYYNTIGCQLSKKERRKWDGSWNIADTHEKFYLDIHTEIKINLEEISAFKIILSFLILEPA